MIHIDTPMTNDRVVVIDGNPWVNAPFARSLERELNAANDRIKQRDEWNERLDERIDRLEEKIIFLSEIRQEAGVQDANLREKLFAANQRIKRLEEACRDMASEDTYNERDKEWFHVIESILGFHPVSITEALKIGISRIKNKNDRIKRLEEALEGTVKCFVDLADSGDAGFWNPDEQSVIIAARAALQAKECK